MTSTFRWYLVGLLALFGAYVALEYYRPKPIDWQPTLINKDKIPYGTYVLYDQLPRLLATDSVETSRLPIYNQLTGLGLDVTDALAQAETNTVETRVESDSDRDTAALEMPIPIQEDEALASQEATAADTSEWEATGEVAEGANADDPDETTENSEEDDETTAGDSREETVGDVRANYLFVNTTFAAGKADARALLDFVDKGNSVFIVAEQFGDSTALFLRELGIRTRIVKLPVHAGPQGLPVLDSVTARFTNPAFAGPRYRLPGADANVRFVVDSGKVGQALAVDAGGRPLLVRLRHGRGYVYFCSVPIAFTNQFMLRPATSQFAATALSYLPARRTWWDEYQKQGRVGNQSLLRIVNGSEALNTAFYVLLAGGLLFMFVEARRRQRIIPTLRALPNTTLQFTRTVASLYRHGSSHALIAEKKVGLFRDYLRTRFQETNPDFADADFRERLSQKAGVPRPRVDELLRIVNFARTAPQMTDQQLLLLSKALGDFKKEAS